MSTDVANAGVSEQLRYSVLLWRKGYSYVANDAIELFAHPRSLFEDTLRRAKAGEFKLADSEGRIFTVSDLQRVPFFGGMKRFAHLLLRSVFAKPVFSQAEQPELVAFQSTVGKVLSGRFGKGFAKQLQATQNAQQVLQLASERERKAG